MLRHDAAFLFLVAASNICAIHRPPMQFARPNSTNNAFRAKRLKVFLALAYAIADKSAGRCRVVDVGGTSGYWYTWREHIDWSRIEVICLNLNPNHIRNDFEHVTAAYGDATNLSAVADGEFDLAHSNSVIEHVGRRNFAAFAREVRRIAPAYFVQTPNFWFPVEPHARTAFIHWMPDAISARLLMRRKFGYWKRQDTYENAIRRVRSAELLTRAEMASLFPDADIRPERFAGLVKSWLAVRHHVTTLP